MAAKACGAGLLVMARHRADGLRAPGIGSVTQKVIGLAECPVLVHVDPFHMERDIGMSDALNYLVKARPEAMGHYFAFLKDCGKHLDPKTRDLISVITKVHAQTERGFRQYLRPRAARRLHAGRGARRAADGLSGARPGQDRVGGGHHAGDGPAASSSPAALGLPSGEWHDVMATGDLEPGGVTRVECDGRGLFVHHGERRLEGLRQPLPAPDHQHPAPGAARHAR